MRTSPTDLWRRAQARFRLDHIRLESFLARIKRGGVQLRQLLSPLDSISLADKQFHNQPFHLRGHFGPAQRLDSSWKLETGSECVGLSLSEFHGSGARVLCE